MYTINVSWIGGPNWDDTAMSSFNPNKKKSATEHLIETGGQSIDEAIVGFDTFRPYPIKVLQTKPKDSTVNWVTTLIIEEKDPAKSEIIKTKLVKHYSDKQEELKTNPSGYRIEIEVISPVTAEETITEEVVIEPVTAEETIVEPATEEVTIALTEEIVIDPVTGKVEIESVTEVQ
jgi:hypothetical protein